MSVTAGVVQTAGPLEVLEVPAFMWGGWLEIVIRILIHGRWSEWLTRSRAIGTGGCSSRL